VVEYRKLYGGSEPEGEVRAETTFDIRLQIDLAAKGLKSMKIRDNLFTDFLETKTPDLKSFIHVRYKRYRNRIVFLLRLSKKLHYSNYFAENSGKLKLIWKRSTRDNFY